MTKRYVEDVLPLGELNKYAQKGGGIGSLNAMHPYFARRPLTASRAMTLAALIDAPGTDLERKTFERLLIELSNEEWPDKPELLEKARQLIRKAHGGRPPRVLDPFAGGGSMPLEAMRLGCEATALDLNPVAYLALIASLVYPQEFGQKNGDPDKQGGNAEKTSDERQPATEELPGIEASSQLQTTRLVEDVRHWAEYVILQAETDISDCYDSTDPEGVRPVAYLWAKTIVCPHCGGEIPLIKGRWLQQRDGYEAIAYRLNVEKDTKTYEVEILRGEAAAQSNPGRGTMRGATVECIYCGTPSERERIVEQGQAGQMGEHMLVVVLHREGEAGRDFRRVNEADHVAYARAIEKLEKAKEEGYDFWGFERLLSVVPDESTPPARARSVSIRLYGITEWGQLFNERQALAIITLGQQIRAVRGVLADMGDDYAQAIALCLDFMLAKHLMYNARSARWIPQRGHATAMARHDIPMVWDYAEANPLSKQATSWDSIINSIWRSIENLATMDARPASVRLGSATRLPAEWTGSFDAVITDPPYYDSVTYADLTDYFYPWHKRVVGDDHPEAFVTEVTPKDEELVQEAIYHGGTKGAAKQFYEDGMARAFSEMHRVLRDEGIAVVMFAHKAPKAWETLVGALIQAGFQVTASWPLQTEGRRLQSYRAVALASSVYLVCRKRCRIGATIGYLEDIETELRRAIRRYLARFWAAGIGGADFFMSAIGPGLSFYSRYARVERYDGTRVKVGDFLDLVRYEVAAFAIERIIGEKGSGERLDSPTQFYVLWLWGYNDWAVSSGDALLLSAAVGIELNQLMDRLGLVGNVKGKLRLLDPSARAERLEKVVERVIAGGAVPLVDVIHKACLLWQKDRQEELSALIAARGGEMWPVAQAVAELLPRDNPQRKALESMLGTRMDLESRARQWAETYQPPARAEQLKLWE